jgi:hypothetical protein
MNGLDFDLRVLQPWARDPAYYQTVWTEMSDTPEHEGPAHHGLVELWTYSFPLSRADEQQLARELQVVPPLLMQARETLADFLGATAGEIAFGANMTTLLFHIARAIGRGLKPGDEVIIPEPFYANYNGFAVMAGIKVVPITSSIETGFALPPIEEFEQVSRAVVSSILLAAVVQALLAGLGFYVAGLGKVFLLTLLTFVGALVPIAGAAIVWGAASLYLLFFEKNTWAAAGLALWGMGVVSTVDNIIKPIVLHGQSKLHPLLALLSVLGGVGALGPIGIFVGPIAVAFLQAALTMLQTEITSLSEQDSALAATGPGAARPQGIGRRPRGRHTDPPAGLA